MFPRTKNKKAISTVLTTMIILVASVVLGTGVVLYGTSLFQTNANTESITTTGIQVWVDSTNATGWSWGAADVRNSGDKLLSLDQIQVRGQAVPYASWYADTDTVNRVTAANFQSALIYTGGIFKGATAQGSLVNGTAKGYTAPLGACANQNAAGTLLIQLVSSNPTLCLTQQSGPISL